MSRRDKLHENYITSGWYYVLVNVNKQWHNMIYIFSDKRSLTALYLEFKTHIKPYYGNSYNDLKCEWYPYGTKIFLIKGNNLIIIRSTRPQWVFVIIDDPFIYPHMNYKYLQKYNNSRMFSANFDEGPLTYIDGLQDKYRTHKWYTFKE